MDGKREDGGIKTCMHAKKGGGSDSPGAKEREGRGKSIERLHLRGGGRVMELPTEMEGGSEMVFGVVYFCCTTVRGDSPRLG